MYSKNEYVVYGTSGVCLVSDIVPSPFDPADPRLFYVLKPVGSPSGSAVFTPVENEMVNMRALMSREQINDLRDGFSAVGTITVTNEKQRRNAYRDALAANDPHGWVRVLRTVTIRRRAFAANKKRLPEVDNEYEAVALRCLCREVSLVLGTAYETAVERTKTLLFASCSEA